MNLKERLQEIEEKYVTGQFMSIHAIQDIPKLLRVIEKLIEQRDSLIKGCFNPILVSTQAMKEHQDQEIEELLK